MFLVVYTDLAKDYKIQMQRDLLSEGRGSTHRRFGSTWLGWIGYTADRPSVETALKVLCRRMSKVHEFE